MRDLKNFLSKISNLTIIILLSNCFITNQLGLTKEKDKDKDNNNLLLLAALAGIKSEYVWDLPPGFPTPRVPSENPMSQAKVNLGRHLFFEKRLSGDESKSCSSCHFQSLAFSDGRSLPSGITGQVHPRNSQHLSNVAYNTRLTWNNPNMINLEVQSRVPLFGSNPIELGLTGEAYLGKLKSDSVYVDLFDKAFGGGESSITEQSVRFALASFQRTMISGYSPFDSFLNGNRTAISASAARGSNFFNGEVAECFHCHGGFNFTDTAFHNSQTVAEVFYHNNGTHTAAYYNGLGDIHKEGLKEVTGLNSDQGKFRAPSLRNVGVTFPYMHDGSIMCDNANNPKITSGKTIEDCARDALGKVIDQYASGGVAPVHSNVDTSLIRSFAIQPQEKQDLINFLLSLTDQRFLSDPKFSNPRQ
ncbi:MAG: di-heme enzyme [Leptospiraceae bacterium]|nr:di-heme enzyme [Leptospiraceae bacterium]MCZ8347415.1 di-heme enzyme [Leptospiraceae bacterium]